MPPRPQAFVVRLAAIVAAGVVLRALYLFTIARNVTGIGDWHFYHWQANLIADGRGFLDPFALLNGDEVPSAAHPPLYPLALAVVSKLGGNGELSHRSLGLLLGAATIVVIALLARRVAGERAGLVAAGLAAAYPVLVAADGALMSESLYGLLVAGGLLAGWDLLERPRPWVAAAAGALVALAALTRSEALLLLPLLVLPVAWRGGPAGRWARMAAAVAAFGLVLSPWMIRNATTFERFVPISTNDATVIAGANCDLTYHGIDLGGWNIECISPRSTKEESVQASIWRREGLHYARTHVSRWPVVAAVRFLRVWDLYQPRRQVMFAEGRQRTVDRIGIVAFGLLVPFAVGGLLLLRRRRVPLIVLTVPFFVVSVTAMTGYGVPRLRHMAEIPLVVLAAVAIDALVARRQGRSAASSTPASTSAGSVTAGISHIQSTAA